LSSHFPANGSAARTTGIVRSRKAAARSNTP